MIAQVVVDVVHDHVAKPFSYLVPDGMSLSPGTRVRVPLGRRQVDGVVVALADECDLPPERMKPVARALEPGRRLARRPSRAARRVPAASAARARGNAGTGVAPAAAR